MGLYFSFLKAFRNHNEFLLPDRAQVTMTAPFMRAYSLKVIQTCHRRNAPAIGGMAAQIPIKTILKRMKLLLKKCVLIRSEKL